MKKLIIMLFCGLGIGFTVGSLSPIGQAFAQLMSPAAVNGCIYFSTPPTLANRQQNVLLCDSTGKLITG